MTLLFKKITTAALSLAMVGGVLLSVGTKANAQNIELDAAITGGDLRIAVVRPTWWADASAYQVLRVADTAADLTNNVYANIDYFEFEGEISDSYYNNGPDGFSEYNVLGVVFYDVPITSILNKYFDLARLSSTDTSTAAVWNRTGTEQYLTAGLNNSIWRIWDNGAGIYRPTGASAESRAVSNAVVNSILYGYLTCASSIHNGYLAFTNLDNHFNLTGRTYTEADTVLDFLSQGDYATGRGTGVTVLTSAKVDMMELMAS